MIIYMLRVEGTPYFKIGFTRHDTAEDRLKAAQTFQHCRLVIHDTWPGTVEDELALHKLLSPWKCDVEGQEVFRLEWGPFLRASLASARVLSPAAEDPTLIKALNAAKRAAQREDQEVWEGRYGTVTIARGALRGEVARYFEEDEATGLARVSLMRPPAGGPEEISLPHDWLRMIREDD